MPESAARVVITVGIGLVFVAIYIGRTNLIANRRWARRVYWSAFTAGALVFTAGATTTVPKALLSLAAMGTLSVLYAYTVTPYLKIGGHIYALTAANRAADADDRDGVSSPKAL